MMNPKQKAQEIFDLYFEEILSFGLYLHNSQIIKFALIAVDEIMLNEKINHSILDKTYEYWEEVKNEIQKL